MSSGGGGDGNSAVKIPVRHQGRAKTDSAPNIKERFVPTRHSSTEPRRDRWGQEDPYGMNEMLDRIAKEQWEDEIIRRSHVGFVIDEKEEELIKLREKW